MTSNPFRESSPHAFPHGHETPLGKRRIHREHGSSLKYTKDYQKRLSIIRKVLVQEKQLFEGGKVNNIQVDGISPIEILSFKAFNEDTRLRDCIRLQQKLMNTRVRCVAADSIYANNANRRFCTKFGISTSFVRKGRAARDEAVRKILRSELSRERYSQTYEN